MAFEPTDVQPVGLTMTPHGFEGVGRAIELGGARAVAAYDDVVQRWGLAMYDEARANLTGQVLHVQTGRLASSWAHRRPEPMVFEARSDVFYGALWERGFEQKPGYFPVRDGGQYTGETEWRYTRGGWRHKPWAQPAVDLYEDDFARDVDATTRRLLRGAAW